MANETSSIHLVDPELRPILDVFKGFEVSHETLPMLRGLPAGPALNEPSYKEVFVERPEGAEPLRLIVIDPHNDVSKELRPVLLYMHGGGFVFGSPETILPTLQRLSQDVGCVIVLPAYRLAPEFIFPAALDDNYLALSWIHEEAEDLGVDTSLIAIGGDSAGGGHAALLSLAVRDRKEFKSAFQFLIYPMLDDRTGSVKAAAKSSGEFIWTPENNVFGWSSYLGCVAGSEAVPNGAVPARIKDLSGLPPTLIATGSLDLFAQENIEYGQRLLSQGVEIETEVFEGAYHGFNVMLPDTKISRRFHDVCVSSLRQAFRTNGDV